MNSTLAAVPAAAHDQAGLRLAQQLALHLPRRRRRPRPGVAVELTSTPFGALPTNQISGNGLVLPPTFRQKQWTVTRTYGGFDPDRPSSALLSGDSPIDVGHARDAEQRRLPEPEHDLRAVVLGQSILGHSSKGSVMTTGGGNYAQSNIPKFLFVASRTSADRRVRHRRRREDHDDRRAGRHGAGELLPAVARGRRRTAARLLLRASAGARVVARRACLLSDRRARTIRAMPEAARVRACSPGVARRYDRVEPRAVVRRRPPLAPRRGRARRRAAAPAALDLCAGTGDLSFALARAGAAVVAPTSAPRCCRAPCAGRPLARQGPVRLRGRATRCGCRSRTRRSTGDGRVRHPQRRRSGRRRCASCAACVRPARPRRRARVLHAARRGCSRRVPTSFYFRRVLPRSAAWLSGDRRRLPLPAGVGAGVPRARGIPRR